jgi:hypothetical protein
VFNGATGGSILKIITACAAAAFVFCPLSLTLSAFSRVETTAPTAAPNAAGKGDRLDIGARGATCPRTAEPRYDSACLYDGVRPASEVRKVRVVSADRFSVTE